MWVALFNSQGYILNSLHGEIALTGIMVYCLKSVYAILKHCEHEGFCKHLKKREEY